MIQEILDIDAHVEELQGQKPSNYIELVSYLSFSELVNYDGLEKLVTYKEGMSSIDVKDMLIRAGNYATSTLGKDEDPAKRVTLIAEYVQDELSRILTVDEEMAPRNFKGALNSLD